jgi:hypothetical protein
MGVMQKNNTESKVVTTVTTGPVVVLSSDNKGVLSKASVVSKSSDMVTISTSNGNVSGNTTTTGSIAITTKNVECKCGCIEASPLRVFHEELMGDLKKLERIRELTAKLEQREKEEAKLQAMQAEAVVTSNSPSSHLVFSYDLLYGIGGSSCALRAS